jgi:ElaB/YqjD/DUF883 family membrane-anchored ribosome-binding protein
MASTTKTVEEDIQALRADITALAESMSHISSGAANAGKAAKNGVDKGLHGVAGATHDFMADAGRLTGHSAEAAQEAANNVSSLLAGEIKRNPFVAVAAALCVGFVAGIAQHR